jgi:hypothetical protein
MIKMNMLNNSLTKEYVNSLTNAAPCDSVWKDAIGLPNYDIAKQILSVKAYWAVDYNYDGVIDAVDNKNKYNHPVKWDTIMAPGVLVRDRFYVILTSNAPTTVQYVSKGIEEKIRNNPYLKTELEIQRNAIIARIQETDYQIKMLDSLQRYEYFSKSRENGRNATQLFMQPQGQMIEFQEKDQRILHSEALALQDARIALKTQLESPEMEVISDDVGILVKRIKYSFAIMTMFWLALLVAVFWDNRRWVLQQILSPFYSTQDKTRQDKTRQDKTRQDKTIF